MESNIVSIRLKSDMQKKVEYFCNQLGVTQTEFIRKAVEEKLEKDRALRSGDLILTIPNPQRFVFTPEQGTEVVNAVANVATHVTNINGGLDAGLYEIVTFYSQRFFKDSESQRKTFENNFNNDLV